MLWLSCEGQIDVWEMETIHYNITIWYTNFIPMPQAMKIPAAKAAVDRMGET